MKNNNLIVGTVIISLSGLSFFGGIKYQQSKSPATGFNRGQFPQGGNRTGGTNGINRVGGQIIGEIISADDKSITVKLTDGGSKIILIGSNTSIIKSTQTTSADLVIGTKVGVFGQTNTDGSVTAQNIQLNPQVRQASPSGQLSK